jgi:murein DD-endopeptidase MepM/ murein hydrolase activator NlpD
MAIKNISNRFASFFERLKHFSARDVVKAIETTWQRIKAFIAKARETYYRLVIRDEETLQDVGSYRLSVFNFYVFASSLFVGFTALGMALIVFTPLKKMIPGFGGYGSDRSVFNLYEKVEDLERTAKANEVYTENFRKMLTADVETVDKLPKDAPPSVKDSNTTIEPSAEELKIRAGGSDPFDETSAAADGTKAIKINVRNDRLESMFLQAPVNGGLTSGFSLEKKHYGIDISAPKNTPIKAIADGFVISSDWTLETGNTIAIQHANNVVSFYKHNSNLLKKVGDKVKTGEAIAIIGNTGEHTTGPHLHFELWQDGKAVNPQEYIRF